MAQLVHACQRLDQLAYAPCGLRGGLSLLVQVGKREYAPMASISPSGKLTAVSGS
jgi:hypothetical protein